MSNLVDSHQVEFNNYLVEFIRKMRVTCPTHEHSFGKYYKYYRSFVESGRRLEFIEEFIKTLSRYQKEVSTEDEGIFSEEVQYYPGQPIELLKSINFKEFWNKDGSWSEETKHAIWKYLHTLYIIGNHVLQSNQKLTRLLASQKELLKTMAEGLKNDDKIRLEAERQAMEERLKEEEARINLDGLLSLFGKDNIISEIAVFIVQELKMEFTSKDGPLELIKKIFDPNSQEIKEVITRIEKRLEERVKERGWTAEKIKSDLNEVTKRLGGMFKDVQGLPNIEEFCQKLTERLESEDQSSQDAQGGTADNFGGVFEKMKEWAETVTKDFNLSDLEKLYSASV